MNIQRGFRDKLEKYANPNQPLVVEMQVNGQAVYDYCCFGVDANGKLSDDRYMVFYNQLQSPNREISYTDEGGKACFTVNLHQLPASIQKLVFTVSIDGNGTMGQITSHILRILQNQQSVVEVSLTGKDFQNEKAIISMEVYRKDVWRFAAVASGFNGGLGDLLRAYGGEESTDEAPSDTQTQTVPSTPDNNPVLQNNPQQSFQQPTQPIGAAQQPAQQSANAPQGYVQPSSQPIGTTQGYTQQPAQSDNDDAMPSYSSAGTYAIPSSQTSVPQGSYAPPPTYSIPSAQGNAPQGYAPPPTYSMPSPQGSIPPGYAAPPSTYGQTSTQGSMPTNTATTQSVMPQNPAMQNTAVSQGSYTPMNGGANAYTTPAAQGVMPQNPAMQNTAVSQGSYTPMNGGTNAYTTPAAQGTMPQGTTGKVSLEKKLQKDAPQLVSLAKPLQVELEKRNLQNCVARVALVVDMSGSMTRRYANGTVQDIINKTLPLAVQFDDDGQLDFWFYGGQPKRMPPVNMQNYMNSVPANWREVMHSIGATNNEPPVMKEVVSEYKKSRLPAYVLFVTDGGVSNEAKIKKILKDASRYPIFWQFVGVGGSNYGILERLDSMTDRLVDNAGFFALDDFQSVSSSELYSRLLNEFPVWLDAVKRSGMI